MRKLLFLALLSLALPPAASAASINLSATVGSVNRTLGIGSATTTVLASFQGDPGSPAPCPSSPENPTAMLAVLGITGLFLGRAFYGRMRDRNTLTLPTAA